MRNRKDPDLYRKMTETPIVALVLGLGLPTTLSSMITNLYNVADTYFVGKAGTSATAAVGVVFGLQCIIHAIGFTHGHGAGSNIARQLGAKQYDMASVYASTSYFFAIFIGFAIMLFGFLFLDPLCNLLGSTDTILPYARIYCAWVLLAAPGMAASNVANNILRYEGKAVWAMVGLCSGGLINIFGDWLMVVVFGTGVWGAGLATCVSQYISFILLTQSFLRGKTQSKLQIRNLRKATKRIVLDIWSVGSPSLARQGLNSVSTMVLNNVAGIWGDAAVAAMSIVNKVTQFMFCLAIGPGQGFQPVSAFNYGAKRYKRVHEAFWTTVAVACCLMLVVGFACFAGAPAIVRWMRDDDEVVRIGALGLRAACVALPFMAASVVGNMMFQSIGKAGRAFFLSCLRSGLVFVPALAIMALLFKIEGVALAQPVANFVTFLIAFPISLSFLRKLPDKDMTDA